MAELRWLPMALLALLGLPLGGLAWAGPEDLARTLAELRAEVEALNLELDLAREDLRARLRALETQSLELGAQVRQEELRLSQLEQGLASEREARDVDAAAREVLGPSVRRAIAQVRAAVAGGIPYRQAERLAELERLERQLDGGEASPREVATRLWSFTEDELRMTRENTLARQVIVLDGEERLVDVARLGMVAMFFRSDDGQVGRATRRDGAWTWEPLPDEPARQQVQELFLALSRQVRSGPFVLPLEVRP